jgi:NADH dehydrogenase FAD-containing subunit
MVHKLLVIGAGFGGNGVITGLSEAALKYEDEDTSSGACLPWNCFERQPSKKSLFPGDLEITMLDCKTKFSVGGAWQFVWSSRLTSPQIEWPLTDLRANDFGNVQLLTGPDDATVEKLLTTEKRVVLANGKSLKYDTLVLSPGVVSDPSGVPGLVPEKVSDPTKQALDICNIKHIPLIQQGIDKVMHEAKGSPKTILVCVTRMPYKVRCCGLVQDIKAFVSRSIHASKNCVVPSGTV